MLPNLTITRETQGSLISTVLTGIAVRLPMPQQSPKKHLILTMQALPTTAVNQDPEQKCLMEQ